MLGQELKDTESTSPLFPQQLVPVPVLTALVFLGAAASRYDKLPLSGDRFMFRLRKTHPRLHGQVSSRLPDADDVVTSRRSDSFHSPEGTASPSGSRGEPSRPFPFGAGARAQVSSSRPDNRRCSVAVSVKDH